MIITGIVIIVTTSVIIKSLWYVFISSALTITCVFAQSKAKIWSQFIGIIDAIFYIYVAYSQKLFGEAIMYLIFMIPMYLYGIIYWLCDVDKKNNVVKLKSNLSKRE